VASEHRVTAEITVAAPLDVVWTFVSDLAGYADWVETTIEVLSADDELCLGAAFEERTRLSGIWTATTRWTVTELQPSERVTFVGDGPKAVRALALELTLSANGATTEVTSTYSYRTRYGPLGALLELIVRGNVVNDQRRSLRTLSYLAERAIDDPGA
jgi:carbon monoxide dehydrogenase subunit G